jgi:hypothetical protein
LNAAKHHCVVRLDQGQHARPFDFLVSRHS